MQWKIPPIIKVYEALGSVADGRVEVDGNLGKVYSSSKNKFYIVKYDPSENAIMANDNGSYWAGYIGYPAIAFLLAKGVIEYDVKAGEALMGIAWKDVNTKYKNDYSKTEQHISELAKEHGYQWLDVKNAADKILEQLAQMNLQMLGGRIRPPSGY